MQPIALDTNAYVAFKRGDADVIAVIQRAPRILLPVTVLGELLAGFAAGQREAANRKELNAFMQSPRVTPAQLTTVTADRYALVYAALRRAGRPIPTNDMWIAATALEHGAALLTLDAHFEAVSGLRVGKAPENFLP
ncbi:MAG: type II toxin-antitoxin system VapC family toxin [Betaproteobacteria bacterium]|nr:type II toxin-antitoxin system VapC family toxin [Betaproteobacteria bacterium]